jgi:hypothetical protein
LVQYDCSSSLAPLHFHFYFSLIAESSLPASTNIRGNTIASAERRV